VTRTHAPIRTALAAAIAVAFTLPAVADGQRGQAPLNGVNGARHLYAGAARQAGSPAARDPGEAGAGESAAPVLVPLARSAPTIDGRIGEDEWDGRGVSFDGFRSGDRLEPRRCRAWVAATADTLFVAVRSQLPDEGHLATAVEADSLKVLHDDAVEVAVCPAPADGAAPTVRLAASALGRSAYLVHRPGQDGPAAWDGTWRHAHGRRDGAWEAEVAIPIASLPGAGEGRTATAGTWRIAVVRGFQRPRAWASVSGRGETPAGGRRFRFVPAGAAVQTRQFSRDGAGEEHRPQRWVATEPPGPQPIGFDFAYYPYKNVLRIVADAGGLPAEAEPTHLWAEVREAVGGTVVARRPLDRVAFQPARLGPGKWTGRLDLPPLEGTYEIALRVEGAGCPRGEVVRRFTRTRYPWEHTPTGRSTEVYPPFTPIEVDRDAKTLKTVLRTHTLTDLGLPAQITAESAHTGIAKPILAGPVRLVATVDGETVVAGPRTERNLRFPEVHPHHVKTTSAFTAGPLPGATRVEWDYDGCAKVTVWAFGASGKRLERLVLEIPLRAEAATMIHANADRIRAPVAMRLPEKQGLLWDSTQGVVYDNYLENFCPYVYVGDAVRGLCWFAENDAGWSWDRKTPNVTLHREGDRVVLRVHLVNVPFVGAKKGEITFGLLAAPVKPRWTPPEAGKHGWRYRYLRDDYTLLGTDINWFGIGCGSVYPVGRDLWLWEMLARGNREDLSRETVERVAEWGTQYFEESDTRSLESWHRHVHHNLRSRRGKRMVFYYNRASIQAAEEFQTFQDEWGLTDLRSVGPGRSTREIKIVPTPSYVDHALYWYARSFDIGANQGVYWDNFFIEPSFNTEMTAAYRDPGGRVIPAAGIWALRDLARRTFVMMHERGMRPITFPHMTSLAPLPMLAFSTVQYDWEWKYSEGDVQDRFARPLLLLTSTGDLAGVWPVPLADHGRLAGDPWTQRTFTAVRLVHELDGHGGFGGHGKAAEANARLARPVLDLLDEPGLQVYRYWDERPQPVAADRPDVPTIVYVAPGRQAVAVATSYADTDADVALRVDAKAMGFDAGNLVAENAETGEAMLLDAGRLRFPLKKHGVRVIRFRPEGTP